MAGRPTRHFDKCGGNPFRFSPRPKLIPTKPNTHGRTTRWARVLACPARRPLVAVASCDRGASKTRNMRLRAAADTRAKRAQYMRCRRIPPLALMRRGTRGFARRPGLIFTGPPPLRARSTKGAAAPPGWGGDAAARAVRRSHRRPIGAATTGGRAARAAAAPASAAMRAAAIAACWMSSESPAPAARITAGAV